LEVIADESKEPTKRLTFDIPKSLHAAIKATCATEERFMNEEIIKLLEARSRTPTS
jgi:predicted HicB family RNase H-like nuclease